jgi:DNA-binding LacI/PurR family transcriptional regulator
LPLRYVSQRFRGYCDALTEVGIEFDDGLCCLVKDSRNFREMVRELFRRNPDMTALFIGGEVFHGQTFEVIEELKLRIPEDISLAVYDRPPEQYAGMTYLEQPCGKLGLHLFKMVRRLCEGEKVTGEIINSTIINGKSIKKIIKRKDKKS